MIPVIKALPASRWFQVLVLILVFSFTFVLRAHNYEKTPTSNHLDEMLYAWSGIYLIETGSPVSWSTLDYPSSAEVFKGMRTYKGGIPSASVTLYKPWLDEPPLYSLLVGYFAHLYHADRNGFIPSSYIRIPSVFFAAITSIFVFLIARWVRGFWSGVLAMLMYGTIPVMVFGSRTAMPENLTAMILTIMVYLLLWYQKSARFWLIAAVPLLIGIAGLSKPTGYALLPLAIFLLVLTHYPRKEYQKIIVRSLYLILATVPFFLIYLWYGMHFSPEIFWRIFSIQALRPVGFGSLAWLFITPSFDTSIMRDSWYVFCLLSAAYFLFTAKDKLERLVTLVFTYSVLMVMLSGGENDLLSWYRFPSFPFLAILGAWGVEEIVRKADFFASFIAAGMMLGNRMLLVNAFRPNIMPPAYRLTMAALLSPSLLEIVTGKKIFQEISRLVIIGILIVGVWFNIIYIYNQFEIVCESKTCPIVPSTTLSSLHFPIIWRLLVLGQPKYH